MRFGYSSVLGQFVDMDTVSEGDCQVFGIVESGTPSPKEKKKVMADLKKRASILGSFLQSYISEHSLYKDDMSLLDRMEKSKGLVVFRESIVAHHKNPKFNRDSFLSMTETIQREAEAGLESSPFSKSIEKELAFELWKFLLSSKGREYYVRLFGHSYLLVADRLLKGNLKDVDGAVQVVLFDRLIEMKTASKKRVSNISKEMVRMPSDPLNTNDDSKNCFNSIGSEISSVMMESIFMTDMVSRLRCLSETRQSLA